VISGLGMTMRGKLFSFVALLALLLPMDGFAVVCTESVTQVIAHSSGNIYFTTDKTCANWCQLNYSSADAVRRVYALLLAANAEQKNVSINWTAITDCSQKNATYAAPDYVILYR